MSGGRNRRKEILLALASAFFALVFMIHGCGGGGGGGDGALPGPFQLTFLLDASFQGPHGDNTIHIAVVRSSDNVVVDGDFGTVSATMNPSFTFVSGAVMDRGTDYEVHYWIDSNIGGGTLGFCDPKAIDHQWSVEFLSVTNDKVLAASYIPALTEDVCSTFP